MAGGECRGVRVRVEAGEGWASWAGREVKSRRWGSGCLVYRDNDGPFLGEGTVDGFLMAQAEQERTSVRFKEPRGCGSVVDSCISCFRWIRVIQVRYTLLLASAPGDNIRYPHRTAVQHLPLALGPGPRGNGHSTYG